MRAVNSVTDWRSEYRDCLRLIFENNIADKRDIKKKSVLIRHFNCHLHFFCDYFDLSYTLQWTKGKKKNFCCDM